MKVTKLALFAAVALAFCIGEMPPAGQNSTPSLFGFINEAGAVVGRPATPGSVAGAARRTTRRTIRRGAYIAHLPAGCPLGHYYGYSLYYCGGSYYQKSGGGYVIVYF
jgi:hypothetical protein